MPSGLGYPTQKPVALADRLIEASSNPGDVVLDPFCDCGTTVDSAQALGHRWVGIGITHLSIGLIKHRLAGRHGRDITKTYRVVGEPTTAGSYESPWGKHPRLQMVTVAQSLDGRSIDYPQVTGANVTFRRATRVKPLPKDIELFARAAEEPADHGDSI